MNTPDELARLYLAAWNEPDEERRRELVARTYTEEGTYLDPLMQGGGHREITAMIGAARAQFPGHHFRLASAVDAHHDLARFSWELAPEGGEAVARGTDVVRIVEGRFGSVFGFLDPVTASG
ncbi:nuclear transport factor 2 family protein [Deinococcus apachensis]|uniref:nuclear transport factor 2 family protein n=1 Tax=Deinococcus apachensis TaxID=309886 RepID=UPI00037D3CD8|nr:nuclear transport factor 2 family protein [Deinococcus apachensis]